MSSPVVVQLHRNAPFESWGFRLKGGSDFGTQLSVKKVQSGTPSDGRMHPGDAILGIGGTNTKSLTHMQAHQLIKSAGNVLQLTILKGHLIEPSDVRPKGPLKFSPWKV